MNKDMATATTKPKEELKTPEQLEAQKHYLELRQNYARLIENQNALSALAGLSVEEAREEYLEDVDRFLGGVHREAVELDKELNSLEQGTNLPKRLVNTDAMDKEFFDAELNKVKQDLGEPIVERKPKIKTFLRPEEYEMIKNNFPMGLLKYGTEVKYDGDQWIVAGYDGYTGRAILKANLGDGKMEYIFADRVDLYLENRQTNRDLAEAGKTSTEAAEQNGLSPKACIEMSGDDDFDYERDRAEQEARQPEKLTTKFKSWVREKYEKAKKELDTLPVDITDVIKTEKEPFKATVKDIWETVQREWTSAKATGIDIKEELAGPASKATLEDIKNDLNIAKEKVGKLLEGRRQAMGQAWAEMKMAREFRFVTERMGQDLEKMGQTLKNLAPYPNVGNLDAIKKWIESGYDPSKLDDETLYRAYGYYNEVAELLPEEGISKEERNKLFDIVFLPLKAQIEKNERYQQQIVQAVLFNLSLELEHYQSKTASLEDMEVHLEQLRGELDKELTKIREGQTVADKKKFTKLIRDTLDKDYLERYVKAPLKIFQSRPTEKQPKVEEREVFEI